MRQLIIYKGLIEKFKQNDDLDLIDVIVRVAIGKHREWIHNRNIDKY